MLCAVVLLEAAVFSMRGLARLARQLHEVPGSGAGASKRGTLPSAAASGPASPDTRLALPPQHLPVPAAVLDHLDLPVFRAGGHREAQFSPTGPRRTAFFASVDLAVNVLTLGVQLFLTGRIVGRLGVGATLAILPAFSILGFRGAGLDTDHRGDRRLPGAAPGRQLRHRPADPRGAVHGGPTGGPLQGQELHRHGGSTARRSGGGMAFTGIGALGLGRPGSPEWRCRCRS